MNRKAVGVFWCFRGHFVIACILMLMDMKPVCMQKSQLFFCMPSVSLFPKSHVSFVACGDIWLEIDISFLCTADIVRKVSRLCNAQNCAALSCMYSMHFSSPSQMPHWEVNFGYKYSSEICLFDLKAYSKLKCFDWCSWFFLKSTLKRLQILSNNVVHSNGCFCFCPLKISNVKCTLAL